jgi:beta-glucosidase
MKRPIYITENGTCDNQDTFRCKYIYEHLKVITESDLPISRYYHWCFCDNFEWLEGESARFGLVHVNYETQERTVKRSGEFYSDVIRAGGVTEEIYNTYVRDQTYHF